MTPVHDQSRPPSSTRTRTDASEPTRRAGHLARAALVKALRANGEHIVADEVSTCCNRVLRGKDLVVRERGDGRRHMCGMNHCKRMLCPICGPYLIRRRLHQLRLLLPHLQNTAGLRHFLVTLTLRHGPETNWASQVRTLARVMTALQAGRPWKKVVVGYARVLETSFGPNGHHPHHHVLLTVRPAAGWNPETFFEWIRNTSERTAAKVEMDCSFTSGWWSQVEYSNLPRVATYLGQGEKWGGRRPAARGDALDHTPPWCMPSEAFAEVWRESRGIRWFAAGGCWKGDKGALSEAGGQAHEEEASGTSNRARHEPQKILLHIPVPVFRQWPRRLRLDRLVTIYDPAVPSAELCRRFLEWGAILGPPHPSLPTTFSHCHLSTSVNQQLQTSPE